MATDRSGKELSVGEAVTLLGTVTGVFGEIATVGYSTSAVAYQVTQNIHADALVAAGAAAPASSYVPGDFYVADADGKLVKVEPVEVPATGSPALVNL